MRAIGAFAAVGSLLAAALLFANPIPARAEAPEIAVHNQFSWDHKFFVTGQPILAETGTFGQIPVKARYAAYTVDADLQRRFARAEPIYASDLPAALISGPLVSPSHSNFAVIPALPDGTYVFCIEPEQGPGQYEVADIGSLVVIAVRTGSGVVATAFDARTSLVRSDVQFESADTGAAKIAIAADALGQGVLPQGTTTILAHAADGSNAYVRIPQPRPVGMLVAAVVDRASYAPGDTVSVRLITRHADAAPIVLSLRQTSGARLWTDRVSVSRFGIATARIRLAADTSLGLYSLYANEVLLQQITVAAPAFAVEVLSAPRVTAGDDLRFAVAGPPDVTFDAAITYRPGPYPWTAFGVASHDGWPRLDAPIAKIHGRTDAFGSASFAVRTPSVETSTDASVEITATDANGRSVTTYGGTTVEPAATRLSISSDRQFSNVRTQVGFAIHADTYDGKPVAFARVDVHAERVGGGADGDPHDAKLRTDAAGNARFTITPRLAGPYHLVAQTRDTQRRLGIAELAMWSVAGASDPPGPASAFLALEALHPETAPSAPTSLLVGGASHTGDILVVVGGPDDAATAIRVAHVVGQAPTIVDVNSPAGTPTMRVWQGSVGPTGARGDGRDFGIAPAPYQLKLSLRPDLPAYHPGDTANVSVHVSDMVGQGVQTELSFSATRSSVAVRDGNSSVYWRLYGGGYGPTSALSAGSFNEALFARPDTMIVDRFAMPVAVAAPAQDASVADDASQDLDHGLARWQPTLETDASGNATIRIRIPANFRTLDVHVVGVDATAEIGSVDAELRIEPPTNATVKAR